MTFASALGSSTADARNRLMMLFLIDFMLLTVWCVGERRRREKTVYAELNIVDRLRVGAMFLSAS